MRKTRARGFDTSLRSSVSIASNITPVTSLPWMALSKVKLRMSAVRSITTPLDARGLEEALSFLLVMAARYTRNTGLSNCPGAIRIKEMYSSTPLHRLLLKDFGEILAPVSRFGLKVRVEGQSHLQDQEILGRCQATYSCRSS